MSASPSNDPEATKVCADCGIRKKLSEFRPDGRAQLGVAKRCIECSPVPAETRKCTICGVEKPIDQFAEDRRGDRTYRRNQCTSCRNKRKQANKTDADREKQREYQRAWYQRNKHKQKKQMRENHLLTRYKMTEVEYEEKLAEQGGGCAICGSDDPGKLTAKGRQMKSFAVDHDHNCCDNDDGRTCGNCVRGLLCHPCNQGMGALKDDPSLLQAAIDYLKSYG